MVEKQRHAAKVSKKHDVPVTQINGDSLGKDAQTTDPSNECALNTIKPSILSSANGAAMARTKSRPVKLSPTANGEFVARMEDVLDVHHTL